MSDATRLRVVLDTNVLLVAVSSRSKYHWIFERLLAADYDLLISNEILSEYEEVLSEKLSPEVAKNVVRMLLVLPNIRRVDPLYRWSLITVDPDDNKFVDCAIAASSHVLVTHDRHFNVLNEVEFPKMRVLSVSEFAELFAD